MPEFANPFPGNVPRQMAHSELVRAIMLNIAAELEAVHLYMSHMDATSNEDARKVLYDIALEELVHAGEFTSLLYRLDPTSGAKTQEGFAEVSELLNSKSPFEVTPSSPSTESAPAGLTVGSLKEEHAEAG
ncbi:MAG TPA: hypothetical protein VGL77_05995 [Armatimonadota bacterium]|jgi:rubrerythrin